MAYQFSYLIGSISFLIIWLIFYLWRRDLRKPILVMSLIFGISGLIAEFWYTIDWWSPLTILNTRIGIEDFLFGFVVGGISSVVYEEIFKKKIKSRKTNEKIKERRNRLILYPFVALAILLPFSFYILKLHTFYASIIGLLGATSIIWFRRRDLIVDSLFSGFLLMIISFLFFWISELITPGWVNYAWHLENLSDIIILKAPLEDLIWFFLTGLFIGPLYEYWQEGRVVDKK